MGLPRTGNVGVRSLQKGREPSVLAKIINELYDPDRAAILLNADKDWIHPDVTFSRANAGMVCDEEGNWTWTALPYRRSYNMETKEWGYLFEPQRTNLCNGTPGSPGPNMTVVAMPDRGALKSYRFSNTAGSGDGAFCFIGAVFTVASGSTVVASQFQSRAPSGENRHVLQRSAGSAMDGTRTTTATALGNGTWRVQTVYTAASVYTNLALIASEFDTDIVNPMECWGWQLETGAVATSPIATNGAQVTVAADVCTYQNNVLSSVDGQSGSILVRGYFPKKEANRPILSGNVNQTATYWMGYQYGPNPIARGGGGTGPGAELFGTPDNATLLMSYNGTERTLISDTQGEATGSCSAYTVTNPLVIGGGAQSGSINHLSVFKRQLDATERTAAVTLKGLP